MSTRSYRIKWKWIKKNKKSCFFFKTVRGLLKILTTLDLHIKCISENSKKTDIIFWAQTQFSLLMKP